MTNSARTHSKTWPRRVLGRTLKLTLGIATLAGIVLAGVTVTSRDTHQPVPASFTGTPSASLPHAEPGQLANRTAAQGGDRRLVVAFVVGASGTVASDLLAPYDIFASSPAFTTYVVANATTPAALEGGPSVLPTYTFADVDADPTLKPDLVVVPGLGDPTGSAEAPLRNWVSHQHDAGARVLGVCSGSLVLSATGMLDRLEATSHWSRISALEKSRPAVHWQRGRRYIEDGSITTTAAVSSGAPAALHLVAEHAGPAEAQRVADLHPELGWTPTATTLIPKDHFVGADWPVGLNYVMPWFRPTVGIALRDGISELDATAAFEVYGQSAAARTIAFATSDTVRTRHGLVLLTTKIADAPRLSRVLVPDASAPGGVEPQLRAWADRRGLDVEALVGRPGPDGSPTGGGGFAAALQNLADHTNAATTSATAKMIGYPTADLNLDNSRWPWRSVLLFIASIALAILAGLAPGEIARRRRQRCPQPNNGRSAGSMAEPKTVNLTQVHRGLKYETAHLRNAGR
jgi:putative intracellular protease/amidase